MPRDASRRVPLMVAAAALAVALAPAWLFGRVPYRSDALAYFWPLRARLAEALSAGQLPLYDALNDGGTPLLLNPQTGALYPPHLLYALVPLGWAYAWMHAGHLALLGVGTARLLRRLGYTGVDVAIGALTVALGGVALSVSAMQDKLFALAWAPWVLAGLLAAVEQRSERRTRIAGGATAAAALALAILGGGLDVVVMTVLVAVCVAALDGGRRPLSLRGGAARAALAAGWIALAAGLAAIQWLPFADWLRGTDWSGGAGGADLLSRSLRPVHLLGLLSPNAGYVPAVDGLRLPWQDPGQSPTLFYLPGSYAGGAGLLLGLLGAAVGLRRGGPARVALLGVAVCLVLALGPLIPPVGWAEQHLPVLSMIRFPHKWVMPAALAASILVAEGSRTLRGAPAGSRAGRWLILGFVALSCVSGALALLAPSEPPTAPGTSWRGLALGAAATTGLGAAAALALWLGGRATGRARRTAMLALTVAICGADLAVHDLPLAPLEDPDSAWEPTPAARVLAAEPAPVRVFTYSYTAGGVFPEPAEGASLTQVLRESLFPGIPASHGLGLPFGWLVMHPAALQSTYAGMGPLPMADRIHRLRLAGVTHLLAHHPAHLDALVGIPLVETLPGGTARGAACTVTVLRIADPLPGVRWTPRDDPAGNGRALSPEVDGNGVFAAEVHAAQPGRLIWLRPWDRFWRATVDGEPVATERVNGHQLSIPLEAGRHRVEMEYHVPSLGVGGLVSALSALTLLPLAVLAFRGRRPGD